MLLLTSTDKIQVITGQSLAVDVHADCVDLTISTGAFLAAASQNAAITTATTTDVVPSPSTGVSRNVQTLTLRNRDATNPVTLTVQQVTGSGTFQLIQFVLAAGLTAQFLDGVGWQFLTVTSVQWGTIGGTLSNQTDLNSALSGKQATLSVAANSLLGNNTGSPAAPASLSVSQTQALLLAQPAGTQSIAMAGGVTTLTATSPRQTIFTGSGSTAQTVILPDATTIPFADWRYEFDNATSGTGILTVQTNGGATLWTIGPGAGAVINLLTKTVAAGTWDVDAYPTNIATGKSQPTGLFVKQTVYTSGSAATHTYQAGISSAIIEGIAGGGGGGGASFSSPNMGFGAGGAAGGYFSVRVTAGLTTAVYTVGAAGSAGANTGGTGGTGGDTIVVHNGVTYTAKGGLGGVGQAAATTLDAALGGAGVAGTNGDILSPGSCGQNSVRFSGILGSSGAGGASVLGGGGAASKTNGAGKNGVGYGSGGGGAAAVSASQTGGTGIAGIVIITEYS